MKRFIAIIVALVIMSVTASAEIPDFLTETYNNYTASYSFTMSFKGGDEVIALLDETGVLDAAERFVDIKALLESMLSNGSVVTVQADISDNFRKAEIAMTSESKSNVVINKNLNLSIDSKTGMWLKMDLDASEPVFQIIYMSPIQNKYMVIDLFEIAESEDEKEQIFGLINKTFSKEYIDSISELSTDLLDKYARITMKGATCVIQIDNDGLIGMLNELFPVINEMMEEAFSLNDAVSIGIIGGADGETEIIAKEAENDFPELDDIQILGKNGLTFKYSLFSGKISRAEVEADISLDISKLAEAVSEEEWPYQTKGVIDLLVKSEVKMTNIGKTKVDFPILTEENSFSLMDMIPQYDDEEYYDEEEYYEVYPWYYVWADAKELPVIDGEYYVPLRNTLEYAYEDTVVIEYSKGIINVSSEYFKDFKNLKFEINSENIYVDGVLRKIPKVIASNGETYVGVSVFEDIFGWELFDITHNILEGYFEIGFCTE